MKNIILIIFLFSTVVFAKNSEDKLRNFLPGIDPNLSDSNSKTSGTGSPSEASVVAEGIECPTCQYHASGSSILAPTAAVSGSSSGGSSTAPSGSGQ